MADIIFECPECKDYISVDERGAGLEAPCPLCGKQIGIPAIQKTGGHHSNTAPCPFCGGEVVAAALKCKHCGKALVGGGKSRLGKFAPTKDNYDGNAACHGKSQSIKAFSTKRIIQGCLVGVVVIGLVTGGLFMLYGNSVYVTESGKTYHADRNCISLMRSTNVKTANSLICSLKGMQECKTCQMKRPKLTAGKPKITNSDIVALKKAAQQGDPDAQYRLGYLYEDGDGVAENSAEAVKWYREAAAQGNADAQFRLGLMYEDGNGVAKKAEKADKWIRRAAEQGHAEAQYWLGHMYQYQDGLFRNSAEAVKWYRMAAEQGYIPAQRELGFMYSFGQHFGQGMMEDNAEAAKWYSKAAEQGDSYAQKRLGDMYATGEGVTRDSAEAVKWFCKAAEQGNAEAQKSLGVAYANGEGVAKDDVEAVKWYRMAAAQGNADAQKALDALGR